MVYTCSVAGGFRSGTGTVDFSGQYAWNFGVLVVFFSTGKVYVLCECLCACVAVEVLLMMISRRAWKAQ